MTVFITNEKKTHQQHVNKNKNSMQIKRKTKIAQSKELNSVVER